MLLPNGSRLKSSFIAPCLPRRTDEPPCGPGWIHEIKHDGFRILARREAEHVHLFTRNGYDFTARFPKIAAAVGSLGVRSCVLDGEAIVVDERGLSVFDVLRYRLRDHAAVLCAFDLIELDGEDLRWQPLEYRKSMLADLLHNVRDGVAFNQHFTGEGAIIFRHACALGCEGIVSKRLGSPYRSGRVDHWLKVKNPAAPAVQREAEEDWGGKRWARGRRKARQQSVRQGDLLQTMSNWSEEETDNPVYADRRNFYKVEKWSRDGLRVALTLYAGNSLNKARRIFERTAKQRPRTRLTIRQRTRVLEQWPKPPPNLNSSPFSGMIISAAVLLGQVRRIMANLIEQAIACDDGDPRRSDHSRATRHRERQCRHYVFPKTWPADREQRARVIGEWLQTEARFVVS